MHFIFSYKINNVQKGDKVKEQLLNVISKYEYTAVFDSLLLVRINEETEWNTIRTEITAIAKRDDGDVYFIMSPVLTSGKYNGWLQKGIWEVINKISGYSE